MALIVITGPTASGKTAKAVALAKALDAEIISADSRQIYRGMDLGTGKDLDEYGDVPYHMIDICPAGYKYNLYEYLRDFATVRADIERRGKQVIVCGGTGLYLNAILYDMDFGAVPDDEVRRQELEHLAEERGSLYMHEYLQGLDPDAASRIHPNNTRKIIRAIEAFEYGKGIKSLSDCPLNPKYDFKFFALTMEREWLYDRINRRASRLISEGLVDEVSGLLEMGYSPDLPSMKGIGYKEIIGFLRGEYDLFDAKELIMKNTRHYAKRQYTWLNRYDFVKWIEITKGETVGGVVDRILNS